MNSLVVEKFDINSIPCGVTSLEIKGNYILTKEDYNNLVVYTNINTVFVYDVEDFDYGNDIKINVRRNVRFNSLKYSKFVINKVDGYKKDSLTINLPFKLVFDNDVLYSEEDDFNTLVKYVNDIKILNINFDDCTDMVMDVVFKLEEKMGKKIQCINIRTDNKTVHDIEKLKLLECDRIVKIWYEDGITDCSIDEFIIMRKNLDNIIRDVESKMLSNFEKVIYVYDIVKKFKFTPSSDYYSMDGRHLHRIFNTSSIVCSGFSRIITEVLNELGINSSIYKLITKDNVLHARSLVHIVDNKYGINAICSMEPTWESAINDNYAYCLFLTPVDKLKECFPKEKFNGDIDVLTREKVFNEISLKDRISLYNLFDDNDLNQDKIDCILNDCNHSINLNSFMNALINVRCNQGISKNIVVSNINNIIKYNGELTNYLNDKMETNINFFKNY